HSFRIGWVEQDRVQPQSTGPRRPRRPRAVATPSWKLRPVLPAVGRLEHRGIFDPGVHMVGIRQRRLEMADALELPWMRCPVVPLMGPRHAVIRELVPDWCPGLAPITRTLNELSEPAAALGRIQPIRTGRRRFQVIDLAAAAVRDVHLPSL